MKNIALLALASIIVGCSDSKPTLYVYTWSDYFSPELIHRFEQQHNCNVDITSFDSNEAMYAKLKAGGIGYDIITPSSYQIPTLAKEGMISKIDLDLLPNVTSNFDHRLDSQILDNSFTWSVPYAVTYGGLLYLKDKVDDSQSWKSVSNEKYKANVSLLDDIRETIGIGLMYNGHSLNSTNEQEIIDAAKLISKWKRNIRKFDAESYKTEISNGSIWLGHGYSADAAQVIMCDNCSNVGFSLPDEGFTIAWDEFVIASQSESKKLSHEFIDFFYRTDVAYENMMYICTLTPNKAAFEMLEQKYKDAFWPKNIDKGQLLKGFEDSKVLEIYNKAWDMIKSSSK